MRFSPFTATAVCSLLIALGIGLARPASAAEIRVLNANALTIALRELAAEHTKQTGTQVTFIFGSPGQIQQKVDAGEKFDLLIMPTPALAALDTAGGLAAGTRRALVRVGIGIAIREGAPMARGRPGAGRPLISDLKKFPIAASISIEQLGRKVCCPWTL